MAIDSGSRFHHYQHLCPTLENVEAVEMINAHWLI